MIDPKIREQLKEYDFVVIPSRCVKSLWQTQVGDLKFTVVPEEDGRMITFINHDSIHLI